MYGENYGTGTLAKSLVQLASDVYEDIDNGSDGKETIERVRWLMEGAFVLMGEMWRWQHESCPRCGEPLVDYYDEEGECLRRR